MSKLRHVMMATALAATVGGTTGTVTASAAPQATAQQQEDCSMLAGIGDDRALIYNDCHYWVRATVHIKYSPDPDCVWVPPHGEEEVKIDGRPEYAYDCDPQDYSSSYPRSKPPGPVTST